MEDPNSFINVAHIYVRDRNYMVYVSICRTTNNIHIFKYDEEKCRCDYEVFPDPASAADYLELLL